LALDDFGISVLEQVCKFMIILYSFMSLNKFYENQVHKLVFSEKMIQTESFNDQGNLMASVRTASLCAG